MYFSYVNLTVELQKHLLELGSNATLAATQDGNFPENYAFVRTARRQIRTEFASSKNEYSVVFFERTDAFKYENCFGRGLFNNMDDLAVAIDYWVGKSTDILEIKNRFSQIELFVDFEKNNPNDDIEQAWTKVKNRFFNDVKFWKSKEWNNKYLQLLNETKAHEAFRDYYPFTSHDYLRFSIDKLLQETWTLDYYVAVPFDFSKGEIFVSKSFHPQQGIYFNTISEGLDFYAGRLKDNQPIKWS